MSTTVDWSKVSPTTGAWDLKLKPVCKREDGKFVYDYTLVIETPGYPQRTFTGRLPMDVEGTWAQRCREVMAKEFMREQGFPLWPDTEEQS